MVARSLSQYYCVYSLDLRNHGLSFRSDSMDLAQMAADVLCFMDHMGIECVNVLGHSLGGKVAMQLALSEPSRVAKLIVADIAPVAYEAGHHEVFAGLRAIDIESIESRTQAEQILQQYVAEPGVRLFLLKNLYRNEQGKFAWRLHIPVIYNEYDKLREANTTENPFDGAVLFIKGENSDYILPEHSDQIRYLFPNAAFKVIQNTGHWLHAEKPEVFNSVVKKFLLA